MYRYFCFLFLWITTILFAGLTAGQKSAVARVPEATITESNKKYFSEEQTRRNIDVSSLPASSGQNIGYILSRYSSAIINNYGGAGSLASISLHGTGSNHTQVSWNGFSMNSPTSGQVDLSLVPAGLIQSVEIISGASGAVFGSSTFGGSINLNNEADWNNRISAFYTNVIGSYGSLGHRLSFGIGNNKFQYQLKAVSDGAENNFRYRDSYKANKPWVENKHGRYSSLGLINNIYVNFGKGNYVEAGLWYQHKMMEIPVLMGSMRNSHAEQRDSLFKSFITYRKLTEKSALVVRSAYLYDYLNYVDKNKAEDTVYSVDSRIAATRFLNETDYRYYFSTRLALGGGVAFGHLAGRSGNFGGRIAENDFAVFGNARYATGKLTVNAGLRKEFYKGLNPNLQYSAGLSFRAGERVILRSCFSSKFRKPTLNEKYYKPYGNPLLKPEKGRGGEISADWIVFGAREDAFQLNAKISGYYQTIDNWIQWVAMDTLLSPVEYKKVQASGMETWLEYQFNTGLFHLDGFVNYNFNRSVILDTYDENKTLTGKQLMYVPRHSLKAGFDFGYKGMMIGFNAKHNGIRETVDSGDDYLQLKAYTVFDLFAQISNNYRNIDFALAFRVDNLTNKSYEIIRAYPVPGRTFHLTLTLGFSKNNPEL
ncbi:MAG: TonB-dependent receptor [Bacteroidales bacterium]|nr:TonB-dependent receptor [Bacteroidales bacterium]